MCRVLRQSNVAFLPGFHHYEIKLTNPNDEEAARDLVAALKGILRHHVSVNDHRLGTFDSATNAGRFAELVNYRSDQIKSHREREGTKQEKPIPSIEIFLEKHRNTVNGIRA